MSSRPTQDLEFFTGVPGLVAVAHEQFEAAARERGWSLDDAQRGPGATLGPGPDFPAKPRRWQGNTAEDEES